jgi:hypothetical protein
MTRGHESFDIYASWSLAYQDHQHEACGMSMFGYHPQMLHTICIYVYVRSGYDHRIFGTGIAPSLGEIS